MVDLPKVSVANEEIQIFYAPLEECKKNKSYFSF